MKAASEEQVFAVKFIPTPGGATESALVRIAPDGVILRRGTRETQTPYREISLTLSEDESETFRLGFPAGFAIFPTSDKKLVQAILASPSERLREGLLELVESLRPAHLIMLHGFFLSILLLAIAALFLEGLSSLGRYALMRCPPSWEVALGRAAYSALGASSESKDEVLNSAVQKIAAPLLKQLPANEYDFQIHVSTSSQVNALAYPGGEIVVYSGLIAETKTPEELAGVLAHEISHVMLRHSLNALGHKLGITAVLSTLPFGDKNKQILRLVPDLLSLHFTREQEEEADLGGGALLRKAGISPDGMVSFFRRMAEDETVATNVFGFLSSHPTSGERAEYLSAIAKQQPAQRFYYDIDWEAVRKEAGLHPSDDPYQLGRAFFEGSSD